MEQVKKAAIVLAAGHGKRMHSKVAKQYLLLTESRCWSMPCVRLR